MSGGKETPRQKMIGMMYLFYTAMLALQVSNSVLERFIFINTSLERQIQDNDVKNGEVIVRITQAIEKRGNRASDIEILNKAKNVRKETSDLLQYCNGLKEEMVLQTGGRDENNQLVGAKDQDKVASLMINQGRGAEMKQKMNDYASFLAQQTGLEFTPLAHDGKDHPVYSNDKDQRSKDFATLFFESTPTAAGMASVSQLMTEIMAYEARALETMAGQVGAEEVRFDKIIVMARPESNMVAAGTKYKADLFLAASSSAASPEMFIDDKPIPIEEGFGKVEFTVSAGSYDNEGKAKKSYVAKINYNDSIYTQTIEYFAVKPVIQIQSASVQALYLNCGNELNVQVPALGTAYNPSFTAKGANVVPDRNRRGYVTVIPSAREVTLTVSSGGNVIGSQTFSVRGIPKPDIQMKSAGRVVDEKVGMDQPPRSLTLEAVPDVSFAQFLPKDAQYRVSEWVVTLARGRRPIQTINVNGPNADLSALAAQARPGDRIVAEVKKVERRNFQNTVEDVSVGTVIKQFQIGGN